MEATGFGVRQINKIVKRLRLSENCVICVKSGTPLAKQDAIDGISKAISENVKVKGIVLIVVDDLDDLSVLNQDEMNEHGWYSTTQLGNFILRGKGKQDDRQEQS